MGLADDTECGQAESPASAGIRIFGDYELGRQLGSGGMGVVYEARQISLNRTVALKFIRDSHAASPTLLRRFTIEAEAIARLHHPNIVAIHEVGEFNGTPYFSMDLVDGESLRDMLARRAFAVQPGENGRGRDGQVAIAGLIARVARALHHAHERGVLHRDLKPSNILVNKDGDPSLSDFGLAKILREGAEADTGDSLTVSGDIFGTPGYMSPEQAANAMVTTASDIHGVGTVLYEMLTGQPPFKASNAMKSLELVREHPPKAPTSVHRCIDRDLETICLKCLEKDPRRRYITAAALAEDLENWIARKPIRARPAGPGVRILLWMKRNRAASALILGLALGMIITLILYRMVQQERLKNEATAAELFSGQMERLGKEWRDPNFSSVSVDTRDIAVLAHRVPSSSTLRPWKLGLVLQGDATTFVQRHAKFLNELESRMSKAMGKPVELQMDLFKPLTPETKLLTTGRVDFAVLGADTFATAAASSNCLGLVRLGETRSAVVMARNDGAITNLAGIGNRKRVLLSDFEHPMMASFKARLAEQGILRPNVEPILSGTTALELPVNRRATRALLTGQADVGAAFIRRYHLEAGKGLTNLAKFDVPPKVLVARAGLETEVVNAFQSALLSLRPPRERLIPWDDSDADDDATMFNASPIPPGFVERIQDDLRKAALFDGRPDPFPPARRP